MLLTAMSEGDGCAVMVGTGVMVGVVASDDRRGGWRVRLLAKKEREKNYHNTVQFIILSCVISK